MRLYDSSSPNPDVVSLFALAEEVAFPLAWLPPEGGC